MRRTRPPLLAVGAGTLAAATLACGPTLPPPAAAPPGDPPQPVEGPPPSDDPSALADLTVIDGASLRTTPATGADLARATAWKRPTSVYFALTSGATLEGGRVRLHGLLVNRSSEAQTVVVLPTGPLGFFVQPTPGAAVDDAPGPPSLPPAPPLASPPAPPLASPPAPPVSLPSAPQAPPRPLFVELPPKTAARLEGGFATAGIRWVGPPSVTWRYLFWSGAMEGTVPLAGAR